MSYRSISLRQLAFLGALTLLGACSHPHASHMTETAPVSNPPPVAPGPTATWYHVAFANDSSTLDPEGQTVIAGVVTYLQQNPQAEATIIGKTDTVGSPRYNMHLSHQRADAVRDALVYGGKVAAHRVETRWTGETRQNVQTADGTAEASNRVVDIAIH
jgi:OOP family OmpA-OmpF porin